MNFRLTRRQWLMVAGGAGLLGATGATIAFLLPKNPQPAPQAELPEHNVAAKPTENSATSPEPTPTETKTPEATPPSSLPWPFNQPPLQELRASRKKAFAFYFPVYPLFSLWTFLPTA